ncbi:hypothetical protein AX774_g4946 [Zancudomyces culisetae]|uniref:Uncharacterized protein n=1 Tax=Zancudomyces culisetae TaxID=1213189 RepID=A0A1R1PKT9_ZANCU|nr:hypothetical protein AX774_g4946 [Zancudomyces culisetae]|eukprot:OMH81591.1 hypothetical protein AX774_g4946 [Zancudomyces culisetae]
MKKNLYPRIKYSEAACPKLPEHLRKIPLVKRYVSSMAARKKDTGMFSVDVEDILRTKDSPISEDKFEKEDAKAIANPAYQDCCCTEIWVPKTDLPVTSDLYGELDKKMITLGNINCSDVAFNDDGSLELNRTTYP